MSAAGVIRGVVGQIRWAYYAAAAVEGYTVVRTVSPHGVTTWSLRASLVQVDRFKMAQRPLVFVAPHARGRWAWVIQDFEIVDRGPARELTANLGPVEEYG